MSNVKNLYSKSHKAAPGILFGIGNPLLDISAECPETFLQKYQLQANNAILCDPKIHENLCPDLIENFKVIYLPGGATQNTIRAFQWALQNESEAKGSTFFTGSVGDDEYLEKLQDAAKIAGVKTKFVKNSKNLPTGTCGCVITENGKNRSLVANLAASIAWDSKNIESVQENMELAQYFYSAGFFVCIEHGPDTVTKLAEYCIKNDKIYMTNLSAPYISQFYNKDLKNAIYYSDIVFGNETEAASWAENNDLKDKKNDIKAIALAIANSPKKSDKIPRLVVITQGADATIIAQNNFVEEFSVNQIPDNEIVDTNGAGDAFVAGFLVGITYNKSIKECADLGNYVASTIIKMPGCTFPEKSEIKL